MNRRCGLPKRNQYGDILVCTGRHRQPFDPENACGMIVLGVQFLCLMVVPCWSGRLRKQPKINRSKQSRRLQEALQAAREMKMHATCHNAPGTTGGREMMKIIILPIMAIVSVSTFWYCLSLLPL